MKYTFLLPAYKGRFLDEMLRSIQGQTYTDFKVIISDDCSPEDLRSICQPYLSDPRFTYRRNAENMGSKSLVSHWNLLVDMCDTEFLIMASDDDVYAPQFLEDIDRLTVKYPEVDLFRARVRRIDEEGNTTAIEEPSDEYEFSLKAMQSHFLPTKIHCIGNFVFTTAALRQKKGFVEFPMAWFSDDATTLANMDKGICNVQVVCFGFRSSEYNISNDQHVKAEVAKAKVEATMAFYWWSLPILKVVSNQKTKYAQNLYNGLSNSIFDRVNWQLHLYYRNLTKKEKFKLLSWMCRNNFEYDGIAHIVKTYIKAILC